MDCPNCGKQNSDDAPLCSSCGWVLYWQTPVRNDVGDGNRCSVTPLICSIVPIIIVSVLIWLVNSASPRILRPGTWSDWDFLYGLIFLCVIFLITLVTIPLGIYSIVSGIAAVREPQARGKTLVAVGIVLGILEIVAVSGYWLWVFSGRM